MGCGLIDEKDKGAGHAVPSHLIMSLPRGDGSR